MRTLVGIILSVSLIGCQPSSKKETDSNTVDYLVFNSEFTFSSFTAIKD